MNDSCKCSVCECVECEKHDNKNIQNNDQISSGMKRIIIDSGKLSKKNKHIMCIMLAQPNPRSMKEARHFGNINNKKK